MIIDKTFFSNLTLIRKEEIMNDKISTLNAHIEKLIHLHQQSVAENKKIVELNNRLNSIIEDQSIKLHQLDEQLKQAKQAQLSRNEEKSDSNLELKNNINRYIEEIDKCLAKMNR